MRQLYDVSILGDSKLSIKRAQLCYMSRVRGIWRVRHPMDHIKELTCVATALKYARNSRCSNYKARGLWVWRHISKLLLCSGWILFCWGWWHENPYGATFDNIQIQKDTSINFVFFSVSFRRRARENASFNLILIFVRKFVTQKTFIYTILI